MSPLRQRWLAVPDIAVREQTRREGLRGSCLRDRLERWWAVVSEQIGPSGMSRRFFPDDLGYVPCDG